MEATPPDYSVWAVDLLHDYETDPAAADRKYAGKVLEVTGTLWSADFRQNANGVAKASKVVMSSWGCETKIDCPLDRSMEERILILDYFSQIKVKGRCAGREGNEKLLLQDCVVVELNVSVKEVEPRATVSASELMQAYWPRQTDQAESYQGRVIAVEGTIREITSGDAGQAIILNTDTDSLAIRCRLDQPAGVRLADLDRSKPIRLKGLCAGRVAGFAGVTLFGCSLAD